MYYLMKTSIENIKFEIEVLRSVLICLRVEFSVLKGKRGYMAELKDINTLKLVLELESRECVKSTYVTEEFSKMQVCKNGNKNFRYIKGSGPLKIWEIELWK